MAYSGGENKSQVYASRDLNSWSYQILDLADCVDLDMDLSLAFGKYPSVSNYDQGLAGIILRSQQAADLADQSKPTSPKGRGFELNDYSITGCNQSQDTTNIWDFGAGETATGKTVYHVYAESGAYRVIVQAKTATQTFSKNVVISASYMTFIPFVVVGGVGCVY